MRMRVSVRVLGAGRGRGQIKRRRVVCLDLEPSEPPAPKVWYGVVWRTKKCLVSVFLLTYAQVLGGLVGVFHRLCGRHPVVPDGIGVLSPPQRYDGETSGAADDVSCDYMLVLMI